MIEQINPTPHSLLGPLLLSCPVRKVWPASGRQRVGRKVFEVTKSTPSVDDKALMFIQKSI